MRPTWKFVQLWRYWLVLLLGLALFALAALQGTEKHSPVVSGQAVLIGVATKAITGVLAILIIRIVQDVMDRLIHMHEHVEALEEELRSLRGSVSSPHLETPGTAVPAPGTADLNHRSGITPG